MTDAPVILFAAGSLAEAMGEIARAFEAANAVAVKTTFGPSGIMRERIVDGAPAHVFASADMRNAQWLAGAGLSGAVVPFAGNALCLIARGGIDLAGRDVLHILLDPDVRLGTSTPGSDPSGDYTRLMFKRAGALRPGAYEILRNKALTLTGGAASELPPAGRNLYAWILESARCDIFVTYRTNAIKALRELPELGQLDLPPKLAVAADYGLTVLKSAPPEAQALAEYITGPEGRDIIGRFGFTVP